MRLAERMNKKMWILILIMISLAIVFVIDFGGGMLEIKFEIGENIHETAKQSGASKYQQETSLGSLATN